MPRRFEKREPPPVFIAFDGIDGAGKTTQIGRLVDALGQAGHDVVALRDPGSTAAGEAIRRLVLDAKLEMHRRCEALLYMAARSQLVEQRIRPETAAGRVVVCDRFLLANVVYQSVGGGEDAEMLWQLGEIATSGVRPDLTVLLDLPVDVAMHRIALRQSDRPSDRMEARGADYLAAVRDAFLTHLPRASERSLVVDARQSVDEMAEQIAATVLPLVGQTPTC